MAVGTLKNGNLHMHESFKNLLCYATWNVFSTLFQNLTRRIAALEMAMWQDASGKESAAEVLILDAMSSEETSYEDTQGSQKVVGYKVKRLSWERRHLRKIKNKLDTAYNKSLMNRARDRVLPRTVAEDFSSRQPPANHHSLPEWAVDQQ